MPWLRRIAVIICFCFGLSGCSTLNTDNVPLYVGVSAPEHYEMRVLHMHLEKSGERSWWLPVGTVSCCWIGPFGPRRVGGGELDPFPNLIALHWFSLAEQKFYSTLIRVPEGLQEKMRAPVEHSYPDGTTGLRPRSSLVLGLAPGGEVVVWMMSQRTNAVEVMRLRAVEVEGDPEDFKNRTSQYLEKHGEYLKAHGVPLSGW